MATLAIKIPRWDIEEETGYKPFTTFGKISPLPTHTACKPFKTRSTVPLMRGKEITSTSQNLCLCSITRYSTTM